MWKKYDKTKKALADVLAHQMTHAETHQRIYQNSTGPSSIPIWFDEGLAAQNDYREPYSNETWLKLTDNGQNIPSLSEYGSGETFFSGSTEDRRARYCLAGHEVSKWLEKNSGRNTDEKGSDHIRLYCQSHQHAGEAGTSFFLATARSILTASKITENITADTSWNTC